MNIIKLLKDNDVTSKIRYYGINDMATGFEVKNILQNSELIGNYLKGIKCTINNLDEYIDFLYLTFQPIVLVLNYFFFLSLLIFYQHVT